MVIDPNNRLPAAGAGSARNKPTAETATSRSQSSTASEQGSAADRDSVLLSPEAHALKRLEAHINASPEIDLGRVAAIKQAIAEGNFEINVERIAERMLAQDDWLA